MKLKKLECNYCANQAFRHIDGGYYIFEKSVLFADDSDELVIYQHVWPFEKSSWARRYNEFKEKFTPISQEELVKAMSLDRFETQEKIKKDKEERRKKKLE